MRKKQRKLAVCVVLAVMLVGILSQSVFAAVSGVNTSVVTGFGCLNTSVVGVGGKVLEDWKIIGKEGFSKGAVKNTTIALDNNSVPYVVYSDAKNGEVTVIKYTNNKWNTVGTEGFSTKEVIDASIAIDKNNIPYVVYVEEVNGKIVVSKFVNGKWTKVEGNAGFGDEASIALDSNGTPYVVYTYSTKNKALGMKKLYGVVVSKFQNNNWEVIYNEGSSCLFDYYTYPEVAIDSNDTPYVAFNHNGVNVTKVSLSSKADDKKPIDNYCIKNVDKYISMAIDSKSNVYVAYQEGSSEKAVVRKYTNDKGLKLSDSWKVSKGKAGYTSIALDSYDNPYVVYMDYKNGSRAVVSKYEDDKWSCLGIEGASKGKAEYTSIAINNDGIPYVAYQDGTKCDKASVSKYAKEFVVTFDSNGGTEIEKQKVIYNGKVQIPDEPEKEGYIFENWYQDKDLTEVFDFNTPVTGDLTLYAKYRAAFPTADLTVKIQGNGSVDDWVYDSKKSFKLGTSVTLYAIADENSEFFYWMDKSGRILSTDAEYTFEIGCNETLTAIFFDKDQKLVTFRNGNGEIIRTDYVVEGKDVEFPYSPSVFGYKFIGWDKTADEIIAAPGNVVVTAKFEKLEETVSISVYGGKGFGEYELMDYVTVIADEPELGQKFAYWVDEKANKLCYDDVYKFYATRSVMLTAVYVSDSETIEQEASIAITNITKTEDKIYFLAERIIPEGNIVISHGIIATNNSTIGTSEEDFILDGTDVLKASAKTKGLIGTFVLYKGSALNETWYARGYVIYKDSEGNVFIIYSTIVQETLN
ncbi:MAG: hypothetical protein BWY74_02836 [Firmicutes bacterium ADurb.Bin419]|nr:MAG: hypothetical protein BWY74_02836 [Firmicutes bacterium ADurb.Bin419]